MAEQNDAGRQMVLQKIYLKDTSFEVPGAPEVFKGEWKPQLKLDLQTQTQALEDELYEVVLTVTVAAQQDERTVFLVEVQQAGLFTVKGFKEEDRDRLLGGYCPGVLYPYARETVAALVMRGGFPQVVLQPVNFDEIYIRKRMQEQQQGQAAAGKG